MDALVLTFPWQLLPQFSFSRIARCLRRFFLLFLACLTLLVFASSAFAQAPAITSPSTASVTVGNPFTYTITASGSPTSYNATGLPAGLSVNTSSGVISGTSGAVGTYTVNLTATNASGTGTAPLALTVNGLFHIEASVAANFLSGSKSSTGTMIDAWAPVKSQAGSHPAISLKYNQLIAPGLGGSYYGGGGGVYWNVGKLTSATSWGVLNPKYLSFGADATFGQFVSTGSPATETTPAVPGSNSFAWEMKAFGKYKLPASITGGASMSIYAAIGYLHVKNLGNFGITALNDKQGLLGINLCLGGAASC